MPVWLWSNLIDPQHWSYCSITSHFWVHCYGFPFFRDCSHNPKLDGEFHRKNWPVKLQVWGFVSFVQTRLTKLRSSGLCANSADQLVQPTSHLREDMFNEHSWAVDGCEILHQLVDCRNLMIIPSFRVFHTYQLVSGEPCGSRAAESRHQCSWRLAMLFRAFKDGTQPEKKVMLHDALHNFDTVTFNGLISGEIYPKPWSKEV